MKTINTNMNDRKLGIKDIRFDALLRFLVYSLVFVFVLNGLAGMALAQTNSMPSSVGQKIKLKTGQEQVVKDLHIMLKAVIELPCSNGNQYDTQSNVQASNQESDKVCGYKAELLITKNNNQISRIVDLGSFVTAFNYKIEFLDYNKQEQVAIFNVASMEAMVVNKEPQIKSSQTSTIKSAQGAAGAGGVSGVKSTIPEIQEKRRVRVSYGVKVLGSLDRPDVWDLTTLGNYVYGVTSDSSGVINSKMFKINTETDEITELGEPGWESYSLTTGKDGRIYGGMYMHPNYNAHLFVYDPTQGWDPAVNPHDLGGIAVQDPEHAIVWDITTADDGKIYAGLGYHVGGPATGGAHLVVYDPTTNNLQEIPLPPGLESEKSIIRLITAKDPNSVTSRDKVYGVTMPSVKLFEYDPETNSFTILADIDSTQDMGAITAYNNKLYIASGGKLWGYDLTIKELKPIGTFTDAWIWKAITTSDGKIHIAAGNGHVYVYDPSQPWNVGVNPRDLGLMVKGESRVRALAEANGFVYGGTAWNGMVFKYKPEQIVSVVENDLIVKWFKPGKKVYKQGERAQIFASVALPRNLADSLNGVVTVTGVKGVYSRMPLTFKCSPRILFAGSEEEQSNDQSKEYVTCIGVADVGELVAGYYKVKAVFAANDLQEVAVTDFRVAEALPNTNNIVFTTFKSNRFVYNPGDEAILYGRYYLKKKMPNKVAVELFDDFGNSVGYTVIAPQCTDIVKPTPIPVPGVKKEIEKTKTSSEEPALPKNEQEESPVKTISHEYTVQIGVGKTVQVSAYNIAITLLGVDNVHPVTATIQVKDLKNGAVLTKSLNEKTEKTFFDYLIRFQDYDEDEEQQIAEFEITKKNAITGNVVSQITTENGGTGGMVITNNNSLSNTAQVTSISPELTSEEINTNALEQADIDALKKLKDIEREKYQAILSKKVTPVNQIAAVSEKNMQVGARGVVRPMPTPMPLPLAMQSVCEFKTAFRLLTPGKYKAVAKVLANDEIDTKSITLIARQEGKVFIAYSEPTSESEQPIPPKPTAPRANATPAEEPLPNIPIVRCSNGCEFNNQCLPLGTRISQEGKSLYCNVSGQFLEQKPENAKCLNNFECSSNSCLNNKCINLEKKLRQQETLLKKILDLLKKVFG